MEIVYFYALAHFPKDPASLYEAELAAVSEHIGYLITDDFYNYGVVNSGTMRIVVGPTRQITAGDQELRELAFRLDLTGEAADEFLRAMKSIVQMPLESILQMLCAVNYMLCGEQLGLQDIQIREQEQERLRAEQNRNVPDPELAQSAPAHNTMYLENKKSRHCTEKRRSAKTEHARTRRSDFVQKSFAVLLFLFIDRYCRLCHNGFASSGQNYKGKECLPNGEKEQ